jgi:hypothetical protein
VGSANGEERAVDESGRNALVVMVQGVDLVDLDDEAAIGGMNSRPSGQSIPSDWCVRHRW